MSCLKLYLGGNVIYTEQMPIDDCEQLEKALNYHAPFVRGDYQVQIIE